MTRIVAGLHRGKRLVTPKGQHTRPTSDRVREAIFNILSHGAFDGGFDGIRVLDAFAGTGALGLEALSRGAAYALFLETDATARAVIRENVENLQLTGSTKIFRRDATKPGDAGTLPPFDLLFMDPPYGKGFAEQALQALHHGGWLTDDAHIVIEEKAGSELALPDEFVIGDQRTYGDTAVFFLYLNRACYIDQTKN